MLQRTCADGVVAEYPERPCRGVRLAEFERDLTRERVESGIAEMSPRERSALWNHNEQPDAHAE